MATESGPASEVHIKCLVIYHASADDKKAVDHLQYIIEQSGWPWWYSLWRCSTDSLDQRLFSMMCSADVVFLSSKCQRIQQLFSEKLNSSTRVPDVLSLPNAAERQDKIICIMHACSLAKTARREYAPQKDSHDRRRTFAHCSDPPASEIEATDVQGYNTMDSTPVLTSPGTTQAIAESTTTEFPMNNGSGDYLQPSAVTSFNRRPTLMRTLSGGSFSEELGDNTTLCERATHDGTKFKAVWRVISQPYCRDEIRVLRAPFTLPVVFVENDTSTSLQIALVSPYMELGNLQNLLQHGKFKGNAPIPLLTKTKLFVKILFQLAHALNYLHQRDIVHGAIHPRNILFDEYTDVQLGDFGLSRESAAASDPNFSDDIFDYGIVVMQMLKWQYSEEARELSKCFVSATVDRFLVSMQEHGFDTKTWPVHDELTRGVVDTMLQCLLSPKDRIASDKLSEAMQSIIKESRIYIATQQQDATKTNIRLCGYCSVEPVHPVLTLSSDCPQECIFRSACQSCIVLIGCDVYCPIICPIDKCKIRSPLGGISADVVILREEVASDDLITKTFAKDAGGMREVACHGKIMGIPLANIHQYRVKHATEACSIRKEYPKPCQHQHNKKHDCMDELDSMLKEIGQNDPTFFMFLYTGHYLVDRNNTQQILRPFKKLVSRLGKRFNEISQRCHKSLIMFDCCYAAALANHLAARTRCTSSDDEHTQCREQIIFAENDCHVQLFSCGQQYESNVEVVGDYSAFTKCLVFALKGANECPNRRTDCSFCTNFKSVCATRKCIMLTDVLAFIRNHFNTSRKDGREDVQNLRVIKRGNDYMVLSYYCGEPLYKVHFSSASGGFARTGSIVADDIGLYGVYEDVLTCVWAKMEPNCQPGVNQRALQIISQSIGEMDVNDILDAVNTSKALHVQLRSDGNDLAVDKWVVCFCKHSESSEAAMHLAHQNWKKNTYREPTQHGGVTEAEFTQIVLREDRHTGQFYKWFIPCWNKYLSLKEQLDRKYHHHLHLEIRETYCMAYISVSAKNETNTDGHAADTSSILVVNDTN